MADLLSIARSGVLAAQQRLNTTSNNIANVGTAGYSRQVVTQSALDSERFGSSFVGSGTYVSDVSRVYNSYAVREQFLAHSNYSNAATSYEKLTELDQIMSKAGVAVPNSLNELFSNVNNIADTPMDLAVRENTLISAEQLAASFNNLSNQLDGQVGQINEQIVGTVDRINAITQELASVNNQLSKVGGGDMNLLDQQDILINELSEFVQVNVIPQQDGVKSVMAGSSMMLVSGSEPATIGVVNGDPIATETRLTFAIGQQSALLPDTKVGGQLEALIEYRDVDLANARREIGVMALGVADAFNSQQSKGFDLDGNVGQPMFTELNDPLQTKARVAVSGGNTGDKQLTVEIDDVNQLQAQDYKLKFDGVNYTMTTESGEAKTLTADPNDPGRLLSDDGFSLRIDGSGTAQAGDQWELQPYSNAATNISLQLTDGEQIAAAGYGLELTSGSGSAELLAVDRNAAGFPANGDSVSVDVDLTTNSFTFTNADGTTQTGAIANNQLTVNGITLEVDPSTAAGSQFTLDLSFGPADNANAVAMAQLESSKLMGDGSKTLNDIYEGVTTITGGRTNAAGVAADSADILKQQADQRVEQESGVNLDEEAADLVRFQQAYQASARVMSVAQETFNSLFDAVR